MLDPIVAAQVVVDAVILVQLRALGDVPGHPFHGNQWKDGQGGTLYHGTSKERAAVILKEGLKTSKAGSTHPDFSGSGKIYLATTEKEARHWAEFGHGSNAAVLAVQIPKESAHLIQPDPNYSFVGKDGAIFTNTDKKVALEDIPPGLIKQLRALGDLPGHEFHGNQWTNAAHATASDLSGVTPNAPLKTYKAYHVTKKANAAAIVQQGFDITKVKPRWQNDYAISLSRGEKAATDYFSHRDPKTGKPLGMDTDKYSLLEVTVKGRLFKNDGYDRGPVSYASSAQDWTHQLVHKHGYDGQDQGATIFVNNPRSIVSVREVPPKVKTLGGSGSGNFGHHGRPGAIGGSGEGITTTVRSEKSRRALQHFVPAYAASQRHAERNELTVRAMVGGTRTQGNAPVDVVATIEGKVKGIEVKTLISNTNDKITTRKSAMAKKDQWAHANHASVHTVVLDDRSKGYSGHPMYYAKSHGSFRISAMTPIRDAAHLKELLAQ